nr:reverse transcriptase domain-containing protein [Tanacetum cinerariifolium]
MAWRCHACDGFMERLLMYFVDEDEDPKEDEFEEKEDPQEEEDDMEVDIEEDENEPELSYPYKEINPLTPSPPASESEPKDAIMVENPIKHEDETVPASVHEVGKSSTAPNLCEESDGLLPCLVRRDINSLLIGWLVFQDDCVVARRRMHWSRRKEKQRMSSMNAKVAIMGLETVNQMPWIEMKQLMTTEYCPIEEIQRMEHELWNLKVKEYNIVAYTQRFNELALMCPRMVKPERVKVDTYIWGLTDNIKVYDQVPQVWKGKAQVKVLNQCLKKVKQEEVGEACSRAYAIKDAEPKGSNVVTGTFLLNNHYAFVLFDLGFDSNFVDIRFISILDINLVKIGASYEVKFADGRVVSTNTVLKGCTLNLVNHVFKIDLMPIELGTFDVIIGMDRLVKHDVVIVCGERVAHIPYGNKMLLVKSDKGVSRLKDYHRQVYDQVPHVWKGKAQVKVLNQCPKKVKQEEVGEACSRAYAIKDAEPKGSNVVTGTFLLNNHYAFVLFDLGFDSNFVDIRFISILDINLVKIGASYEVKFADGRVVSTNTVLKGCTLNLVNHVFKIDLMPIELGTFDVIIGMDRLVKHDVVIVCGERVAHIPYGNKM